MSDRERLAEVIAADLLESDLLTPNHEGTPEFYAVEADNVLDLVRYVLASDALAQMLAEARAEALREAADTLRRIFLRLPHTPSPLGDYVQRKSQEFRRAALAAAEPDAGERDA